MTPQRYQRLRAVLDRRQPDLTVLMDNVHKDHNLSAVLRTCDAVGVFAAHGVWPNPRYRPSPGVSAGSGKWVPVHTHPTLEAAMEHLRGQGFTILAATLSDQAVDYRSVDYTRPTAVLVGAEKFGVSAPGLAGADAHVAIPMQGFVESLNVSVATALILFEAQGQRLRAGLYERSHLDPEVYRRTLFEWGYPLIARACRERGLPYPELDEEGLMMEAPAL
jgi:tRNA (guanosine-2'-O-)-methyltransferase